jgi:hypothetical protein
LQLYYRRTCRRKRVPLHATPFTVRPPGRLVEVEAHLRLRVWAAALRDDPEANRAALAGTLVDLLDVRGGLQADNAEGAVLKVPF